MRRMMFVALLAGGLLGGLAGAVRAQSPEEQIVAGLIEQGYTLVYRDRTWLGRIWLVVENGDIRREIVFNPGTGEILRDYTVGVALAEEKKSGKSSSRGSTTVASTTASDGEADDDMASSVAEQEMVLGAPLVVMPVTGE